ncbi:MAG TPA: hypothetical protein PKA41_02055 [Verrucomicrobiota bacterium]|nr:hypothetical protein [Verrucomicrobiota bacterium]
MRAQRIEIDQHEIVEIRIAYHEILSIGIAVGKIRVMQRSHLARQRAQQQPALTGIGDSPKTVMKSDSLCDFLADEERLAQPETTAMFAKGHRLRGAESQALQAQAVLECAPCS